MTPNARRIWNAHGCYAATNYALLNLRKLVLMSLERYIDSRIIILGMHFGVGVCTATAT